MTTLSIGSICIHVCDQESLCKSAIKSVCVVYMLSKMSVKMCMVNFKVCQCLSRDCVSHVYLPSVDERLQGILQKCA